MKLARLLLTTIILGLLIFFSVTLFLGIDRILSVLSRTDYAFILVACFFQILSVIALFLRWNLLIEKTRIKISKAKLFLALLSGIAFSNITPSARVGGEPIRAYFLRKFSGKSTGLSLSTIIAERVFDAATFLFISLIIIFIAFFYWHLSFYIVFLLFLAFVVCLLMFFFMTYSALNKKFGLRISFWFLKRFSRFFKKPLYVLEKKLIKNIDLYNKKTALLLKQRRLWFYGLFFSCLVWLSDVLRTYFIFLSLGSNVSMLLIAGVLIISALAGAVPITPGGLGLIEGSMIIIYSSFNIPLLLVGMVVLIDRLISYWGLTFIGLVSSYYLGVKKGLK